MRTEKEKLLFEERKKKLFELQKLGVNPYPADSNRTHSLSSFSENFDDFEKNKKTATVAGRIRALRGHGGLSFGNLEDESGVFQFAIKKDRVGKNLFEIFSKTDIGDFVELSGTAFTTKRGEKTIMVEKFRILTKSLLALPEKFHGLKEIETRLRKRYLDMIVNPEVRDIFRKKNVFWKTIRDFMTEQGFLEVQTPVLEAIAGGADATPFKTHHKALDRDFYLRISLEFPLKKLLVGGYEKVYEIGRLFRNEGISREHLQEYDDMEFYWAYADYRKGMGLAEKLFKETVRKVTGGAKTKYGNHILDWGADWPEIDYFEIFKKETGLDLGSAGLSDLRKKADALKIKYEESHGVGRVIDVIYKKTVRPKIIQPSFLVGHPAVLSPLAKLDPDNDQKVQRFQILAGGTELGNGYSELNDPIDQRKRFEDQMKLREAGDKEAQMMDEDFVEALEYGMPPAVGFGVSERLFAVLMDKSIRETVIFPLMREE